MVYNFVFFTNMGMILEFWKKNVFFSQICLKEHFRYPKPWRILEDNLLFNQFPILGENPMFQNFEVHLYMHTNREVSWQFQN